VHTKAQLSVLSTQQQQWPLALLTAQKSKRKLNLAQLAHLIRESNYQATSAADASRGLAALAIEAAVSSGGYLREAKRSKEIAHGEFRS